MINEDSIFLTHHWENRLYMINNEGKVLAKFDLKKDSDSPNFYLMNKATSQLKLLDNNLYITLQGSYRSNLSSSYLLKLNLQDSTVSYYIQEPEILKKHFGAHDTFYFLINIRRRQGYNKFRKKSRDRCLHIG